MFPDDPVQGAAPAFTVVMMGGLFQIGFGLLKLGLLKLDKFIELVPHPVVSGFISGIGVIIILLQFGPLLDLAEVPSIDYTMARALEDIIMDTLSAGRHIDAGNM